jgi:hypothetical protein
MPAEAAQATDMANQQAIQNKNLQLIIFIKIEWLVQSFTGTGIGSRKAGDSLIRLFTYDLCTQLLGRTSPSPHPSVP